MFQTTGLDLTRTQKSRSEKLHKVMLPEKLIRKAFVIAIIFQTLGSVPTRKGLVSLVDMLIVLHLHSVITAHPAQETSVCLNIQLCLIDQIF